MKKIRLIFLLLPFCMGMQILSAQQPNDSKPRIALLGTFHFKGSSDLLAMKAGDIKSEKRQKEIQEVVDALKAYRPTKVLIEYPYGESKIDSLYQKYLNGKHELTINERQQIGFRLAAQSGHEHIYPADYFVSLPFNDLMAFIQETGQMEAFQKMVATMKRDAIDVMQAYYDTHHLKDFYVFMNSDKYDRMNRGAYLQDFVKYVSEDNNIGLRLVSKWWERNFQIMSHIDKITEPGDRILVLFGQGHTALLKPFYQDRNDVEYIDILEYLK